MTDTPSTKAGRSLSDMGPAFVGGMTFTQLDEHILAIEAEARAESAATIERLHKALIDFHYAQHGDPCLVDPDCEVLTLLTDTAPAAASAKAEIEQAAVMPWMPYVQHFSMCGLNERPRTKASQCTCGLRALLNTPATPRHEAVRGKYYERAKRGIVLPDTASRLDEALQIIETGDQRLLASDGTPSGLPPDLSLAEWRRLYVCIKDARALATPEGGE